MSLTQRSTYDDAYDMLVRAVNSGGNGQEVGEELFGAADLLNANPSLRDALTDPARSVDDRSKLLNEVFGSSTSKASLEVMDKLVQDHWSSPRAFAKAIEGLGLDAHILAAMHGEEYETLCQELVDAQTVIAQNRDLRVQLSDIGEGDPRARAALARKVFGGRVSKITERLLSRASYSAQYGQLLQTLRDYADRAASATGKRLVVAYTAEPLTEEQKYRMAGLAARRWDSAVLLTTVIDPSLLGGFRLDAGEETVDTTVRRDLAAARTALVR